MKYSEATGKSPNELMTLLQQKLSNGEWREADELTRIIMLKNSSKKISEYSSFISLDIDNISAQLLKEIDDLWRYHSDYNFGFKNQKKLLKSKQYKDFIVNVGWHDGNSWLEYSNLNFSSNAREGHLPYCGSSFWIGVFDDLDYLRSSLFSKSHNHNQNHYHAHKPHQVSHGGGEAAGAAAMGAGLLAVAPWLLGAAAVAGAGYLVYREVTKDERKRQERLEKEEEKRREEQAKQEKENEIQKNIETLLALI